MFTFVFQPKANRETLREFNERVREYCVDNPVVSLDANEFGGNLILQGTTADDMDADGVPTFTATVRTINGDDTDLEEQLDGMIGQEMEKHKSDSDDSDPNLPVKFIIASGEKRSWVVILCVNGVSEDGPEDGDDGEGTPEPHPAPAAGFQG